MTVEASERAVVIARIASRQHGVFTTVEALAAGITWADVTQRPHQVVADLVRVLAA